MFGILGNLGKLGGLIGDLDPEKLKGLLGGIGGGVQAQQPVGGMLANIAGPSNPATAPDGKVNMMPAPAPAPAAPGGGIGGILGGLIGAQGSDERADFKKGLLAMGAQMMAAGGPSETPTDTFSTMGKGLLAGIEGYQGSQDGRSKRAYLEAQTGRYGMQNAKDQAAIDASNRSSSLAMDGVSGGSGDKGFVAKMFESAVARGDNAGINYWGQRMRDPSAIAAENATESFGTASGTLAANAPKNAADTADRLDKEQTDSATNLRNNWTQSRTYNDFSNISRARAQAGALVDSPSASGFASLVYDFAKIKDPGSAVMDGERKMINGTTSLPDQVVGWFNRAQSGEAPPRSVMDALAKTIDENYQAARTQYEFARDQGSAFARSIKLDPSRIYTDPAQMIDPYQTAAERDVQRSIGRGGAMPAQTPARPQAGASVPAAAPVQAPAQAGKARNSAQPPAGVPDVSSISDAEVRKRYPSGSKVWRNGRIGTVR